MFLLGPRWSALSGGDPIDEVASPPAKLACAELQWRGHTTVSVEASKMRDAEVEKGCRFGGVQDFVASELCRTWIRIVQHREPLVIKADC